MPGKRRAPVVSFVLAAAAIASTAAPVQAARAYPMLKASALLGQHVVDGDAGPFRGNLDFVFVPAVKFSERHATVPSYRASYSATRSVLDVAGGGQLFQSRLSQDLLVTHIWTPMPKLRVKPSAGFGAEFLRETRDEKLFNGLFDYYKPSAGLEFEYVRNPLEQIAVSVNHYRIIFPNYSSLESEVGSGLGRANQGKNTLDSNTTAAEGSYTLPFVIPKLRLTLAYGAGAGVYPEQRVVLNSGDLSGTRRRDVYTSFSGSLEYPLKVKKDVRMMMGFDARTADRSSNQNFYDAEKTQFLDNFYGYSERTYRPRVNVLLGAKGGAIGLEGRLVQRDYDARPAQDAAGRYRSERLALRERALTVDVKIPLGGGLFMRAKSSFSDSNSNTDYEKIFRTNYQFSNHLLGVEYGF